MEIAFVSANKLIIEVEKIKKTVSSNLIAYFINKSSQFIATMLVGNNIALVIYGILMAKLLEPVLQKFIDSSTLILLIQTIFSTLIILVTAEFLPKTIFRIQSNRALKFFAIPVSIIYVILYPFTWIIMQISNFFLSKIFKVDMTDKDRNNVFGKVDLLNLITENKQNSTDNEEVENEIKIFQNALDFSSIKLRECMVPRIEINGLEINEELSILQQRFIETGHSKILIFKENIDNIVGYVHSSELFKSPKTVKSILHKLIIVPETMPANKLLSKFINEHKSVAVVVDEFGGTSGMVTIEDIIEEIFGEIEDEHDTVSLEEKQISENEFEFSGRLEIDYLNEKYSLNITENDDYETLAGYILYKNENVPKLNQTLTIDNFSIKILKVSQTRIDLVKIIILETEQ